MVAMVHLCRVSEVAVNVRPLFEKRGMFHDGGDGDGVHPGWIADPDCRSYPGH